jgi:ribosome maturation factor RimP
MELKEHLIKIVERHMPDQENFLVDIILKGNANQQKVLILIDGDQGVNIDVCAKLSRAVAAELELANLFPDKYTLEVSSPGLDHPITMLRQFKARVGRSLKLTLLDGNELTGKLLGVAQDKIVIDKVIIQGKKQITEELEISLAEVSKAMVIVSFK